MNVSIPGDMAWLSLAAEKFLAGEHLTDSYHDNNPPLSYLIYIPVALLAYTGISLPVAAMIYTVGMLLLFTTLLALLARWGWELQGGTYKALLMGYLISLTLLFQTEMGNKDFLIAAALLPFLMAQMTITSGKVSAKWLIWVTIALATPFILLKPHYCLLPACLLLHRMFKGRHFQIIKDPDFLCLIIGTIIYVFITFIWFDDFLKDVLWNVSVSLYAGIIMNNVFLTSFMMAVFTTLLMVLAIYTDAAEIDKTLVRFLTFMALIAVIPFVAQMKGFSLHMIPYMSLCVPAVLVLMVQYGAGANKIRQIVLLYMALAAGYLFSIMNMFATHDDFLNAKFSAHIRDHASGSGFLLQDTTTNIAIPLSVYLDIPHTSRFSSLWFVEHLAKGKNNTLTAQYATMVAEDLNRYKPGVVALYHAPLAQHDMLALFVTSSPFQEAWSYYQYVATIPFDKTEFYKKQGLKVITYPSYDLYVRK